ncbi:MAG: hypothetical protein ACK5Y2_08030 [Bdellovibrionales bacterium]
MFFRALFFLVCCLFFLSACDQGRVIDQDERRRILYGSESEKVSFESSLQIFPNGSTPQSQYRFLFYNNDYSVYGNAEITSLLAVDRRQNPRFVWADRRYEIPCETLLMRAAGETQCSKWSVIVNMQDFVPSAPSTPLSISIVRDQRYRLSRQQAETRQVLAEYETFRVEFSWSGRSFLSFMAKQNFLIAGDLLPNFGLSPVPQPASTLGPFVNLIAIARPHFPSPSADLSLQSFFIEGLQGRELTVRATFENIQDDRNETVDYVLELL